MNNNHPISDEVLDMANIALSKGEHWMAYNQSLYLIDTNHVYFFNSKQKATTFAIDNFGGRDNYHVIHFNSIHDILQRIPNGENLKSEIVSDHDINGLYGHEGNDFTDALIEHIEKQQLFNSQLKTNVMNNENFEYLNKQLKFTGFGESLGPELKEKLDKQTPEFTLFHQQDFGKDNTVASLQFSKSAKSDMYFFNRYTLLLRKDQQAEPIKQTFYISNKDDNICLKEAYNLMNGRSVQKELVNKQDQKYTAWVQLDFKSIDKNGNYEMKKFHQNYGYNLEQTLAKFPIKEMLNEVERTRLTESLQRGNRQSVIIQQDGKEQKIYIEASPQFKSLNMYDGNMQRVNTQALFEKQSQGQNLQQETKKESIKQNKEGEEDTQGVKQSQKKSQRKKMTIS